MPVRDHFKAVVLVAEGPSEWLGRKARLTHAAMHMAKEPRLRKLRNMKNKNKPPVPAQLCKHKTTGQQFPLKALVAVLRPRRRAERQSRPNAGLAYLTSFQGV